MSALEDSFLMKSSSAFRNTYKWFAYIYFVPTKLSLHPNAAIAVVELVWKIVIFITRFIWFSLLTPRYLLWKRTMCKFVPASEQDTINAALWNAAVLFNCISLVVTWSSYYYPSFYFFSPASQRMLISESLTAYSRLAIPISTTVIMMMHSAISWS